MSARSRVGEVVELCGARLALGQSTLGNFALDLRPLGTVADGLRGLDHWHGRQVAPRHLRALALPDGLATAECVVKKSGHSTDTRPKIQPRSQSKENRNAPGMRL